MRKVLFAAALFAGAALFAARPTWQFAFPPPEADRAFWAEFQEKTVGKGPSTDFDVNFTIDKHERKYDCTFCTVSYNVEVDERVTAYLLIPDHRPGEKLPLVFCLHPTFREGKDVMLNRHERPARNAAEQAKWDNRANALELVKLGFVCFLPDRYGYGDRGPDPNERDVIKSMRLAEAALAKKHPNWHKIFGKVPWDLARALDGLLKLDFIDPARVATEGHSLGGWDSLYVWGTDERVRAAVVNSGGGEFRRRALVHPADVVRAEVADRVPGRQVPGQAEHRRLRADLPHARRAAAAPVHAEPAGRRDRLCADPVGERAADPGVFRQARRAGEFRVLLPRRRA